MSNVQQTIKEMAKLTMLTNKLNDIQLMNLKMYPMVFFDGITEATIDYDLSNNLDVSTEEDAKKLDITYNFETNPGHLRVSYYLTLTDIAPEHLDKRFSHLEESVRNLLWKEIMVEVFFNGEKVFGSKK